jgi:hypothetical protein
MYYIIETSEQLEKFKTYDFSTCFVDIITNNDNWHLSLSSACLLYIRPLKSRAGFILPLSHNEGFIIHYEDILAVMNDKVGIFYAIDAKRFRYYYSTKKPVYCLKTAYYLKEGTAFSESSYDTTAHKFLCSRYDDIENINAVIPISKHYEKLENIVSALKSYLPVTKESYFDLYSNKANKVFYFIERLGIHVDESEMNSHFSLKIPKASFLDGSLYSSYNFFTSTGRPSNSFNGINFAALNKENNSRKTFIPRNDYYVEFDYSSYHLKILCNIIDYKFEDQDIHTHLAKFYFEKNNISPEEYSEAKQLTFKLLYTESNLDEIKSIPFFVKVKELKHLLWNKYKKDGKINSLYSGRPLKNIDSITQILPHILQNYETERNIDILSDIIYALKDKVTKLVLYCYDSFLFDFSKKDGKETLCLITDILERGGYKTSFKYGKNYKDLISK